MSARFFQSVLVEVEGNVLDHIYPKQVGNHNITPEDLICLGSNGQCYECGSNSWILLPMESSAVREGGKPYIECMECGVSEHL
jgi:hypothetical protein